MQDIWGANQAGVFISIKRLTAKCLNLLKWKNHLNLHVGIFPLCSD